MVLYIEGVDGVGKTTIMKAIARELLRRGEKRFVLTKEPGGPAALWKEWDQPADLKPYFGTFYETGELVRDLCVNNPQIPQLAKRALYRADSLCNWSLVAQPAIAEEKIVISDRGWLSDLVYGSVLLNMDPHQLLQFNTALVPELPDVTYVICFTCSRATREKRLETNTIDHMDKLGSHVRDRLDTMYKRLIPRYLVEDHYRFVSTELNIDEVVAASVGFIEEILF